MDVAVTGMFSRHCGSKRAEAPDAIALALLAGIGGVSINGTSPAPAAADVAVPLVADRQDLTRSGAVFQDCPDCSQMVVIPAASFMMGSPETDKDARDDEFDRRAPRDMLAFRGW